MDTSITPLGATVLGLLAERPMHPYEMLQLMAERREDFLVKIRPASVYHAVARLESQGLIVAQGTGREGNRPERTVYSMLPDGVAAHEAHLRSLLSTVTNDYPAFRRGIAEAHNLPLDEVIGLLEARQQALREQLDEFRRLREGIPDATRQFLLHVEYSLALWHAEHVWTSTLIDELRAGRMVWGIHQCLPESVPSSESAPTDSSPSVHQADHPTNFH
ncbi:PadR family transcriptional regulator [Psychromicrobium xiongbiense]|uniref:PadR family transcriptional regulator n=1 Tax=Psychromicrobium xiongbiense TaxID=3051184 RepID=UPI0025577BBF|nr:PadR family transcriptional regulator [Psychromicrobium sp. YIM S02556]